MNNARAASNILPVPGGKRDNRVGAEEAVRTTKRSSNAPESKKGGLPFSRKLAQCACPLTIKTPVNGRHELRFRVCLDSTKEMCLNLSHLCNPSSEDGDSVAQRGLVAENVRLLAGEERVGRHLVVVYRCHCADARHLFHSVWK